MFIVSSSTLFNAHVLETRSVPKRMLGRVTLLPRNGIDAGTFLRLVFEIQVLRYLIPLIPFVIAVFVWPHLALPIAQAPVLMIMAVAFVEMRVLAVRREDRAGLISDSEMARCLDALRFNANRVLTRLAARRNLTRGELLLVIEQSELAGIAPLTLVSVQQADPVPLVLTLDAAELELIRETLFDDQVTERQLHRIALRENQTLRSIALDAATVSAHARMTALLDAQVREADILQGEAS